MTSYTNGSSSETLGVGSSLSSSIARETILRSRPPIILEPHLNVADFEFDLDANAAYIKLGRGRVARTKKGKIESLGVLFDYDNKGKLLGVEILNLKKALRLYFEPRISEIQAKAESPSREYRKRNREIITHSFPSQVEATMTS